MSAHDNDCRTRCGALCCKTPVVMSVTPVEWAAMVSTQPRRAAAAIKVRHDVHPDDEDGDHRLVLDFAANGGTCPFLSSDDLCTVYDVRPEPCRMFPNTAVEWCHLAGDA